MANFIRENPLHQPAQKPLGANNALPTVNHVANTVGGPMFAHLGHFAQPAVLKAGHNTSGHWEQEAVKHPGVEKARAKANGISTHQQLERDAKSSNPTLRRRGNLGLTFERQAARRKGK